jgi:anti-anti-sigma factor
MVDQASAVLAVSGEFDAAAYEPVAAALRELEARRPSAITIDLLDLRFMDCAALRLLCEAAERAEEAGWALTIICPRPPADRALALCEGLPEALGVRRREPRGAGSAEGPG